MLEVDLTSTNESEVDTPFVSIMKAPIYQGCDDINVTKKKITLNSLQKLSGKSKNAIDDCGSGKKVA